MPKYEVWDDQEDPPDAGQGTLVEMGSALSAAKEFASVDDGWADGDTGRFCVRELGTERVLCFEVRCSRSVDVRAVEWTP